MHKYLALMLAFLTLFSISAPVFACEPPPTKSTPPKYTNCHNLGSGYQYGFTIAGARNGTYRLTSRYGVLTSGAPQDSKNTIKITNSTGRVFHWESSLGIDAVIIHAGGTSTVKKLNERHSGKDFYGKLGYDRKPYKIEGISFCYDYELSISTSATGSAKHTGEWNINKTVDFPIQSRFAGETAPFQYTVAVDGTAGSAAGYTVTTDLIIKNDTPIKASIGLITNHLPGWNKWVALDCGKIRLPYTLKPGMELKCSATTSVDTKRSGESLINVSAFGFGSSKASSDIQWSDTSSGSGTSYGAVTVTDTNQAFGGPYTVSAPSSWTYTVNLTCPQDPAVYTDGTYSMTLENTATIAETNLQDSQSVELLCYAPTISGTGASTFDVLYQWGITKTSPTKRLTMKQNQTANVSYDVVVSVVDRIETNVQTHGTVVVSNPHPEAEMTVSLLDEVTQSFPVGLHGCANPVTIPAGQSVTCQYDDALSGANPEQGGVIQVWMNDIVFGSVSPHDFSAVVSNETDECVTVLDGAFTDPLGVTCADQAPAAYQYEVTVGPFDYCYDTDYTNTAYFITNDTETSDFANWQVLIDLLCTDLTNCTYNALYWMMSAAPDPITYDSTWNLIQPAGPVSPFFETGATWIAVLSDESDASVYAQLARDYIVGRLNVLRGAQASPQFYGTLDHAASLLAAYASAPETVTDSAVVADFNTTRGIIQNFNGGYTGPGVCPDCTTE